MKPGTIPGRAAALWRGLSLWAKFAVVAFALASIIGAVYFVKGAGPVAEADAPRLRAVQVASVLDLENDTTPLPLIGTVQSVNEAQIRTQAGGSIKRLNYSLGDYVAAGATIAEIDNASERAALLSAQGAFEAAQASVQKSGKLFDTSKTSAVNTIKSAYSSNDDLIHSKLDAVFTNPRGSNPRIPLSVSDQSLLTKVQNERLSLEGMLAKEAARGDALTENADLKAEIETAIEETRIIKSYIDDLSALLNAAIPTQAYSDTTIAGYVTAASAARTSVSATLAALIGASQALTTAQTSGDTPQEASASEAALKQAQAALDAAQANLNKTVIRAPISGTLNNLSISLGDFVSAFQQVAVVSNNGALEIVARITPEDRATISSGAKVKIENQYDGWVSSIAPAVDPTTKKIEMKIAFSGQAASLVNGASVHLDIARPAKKTVARSTVVLPVAAIKIQSDGPVVFTVDADKKLVAHSIKTGQIIGDKIQVISGVTNDMMLVTDARGLKDGQLIELQ